MRLNRELFPGKHSNLVVLSDADTNKILGGFEYKYYPAAQPVPDCMAATMLMSAWTDDKLKEVEVFVAIEKAVGSDRYFQISLAEVIVMVGLDSVLGYQATHHLHRNRIVCNRMSDLLPKIGLVGVRQHFTANGGFSPSAFAGCLKALELVTDY